MVVSSTLISQHISEWQLMLWNTLILDYFFPNWCSLEYVDKCAPPQKSICLIKCGKRSELAHYKVIMSCISQIYWPWKTPPMFNRKALTSLETVHCSTHLGKLNWVVLGSFLPHFLWHGTVILSMIFLAHAIEGDKHPSQRMLYLIPQSHAIHLFT